MRYYSLSNEVIGENSLFFIYNESKNMRFSSFPFNTQSLFTEETKIYTSVGTMFHKIRAVREVVILSMF